MVRKMKVLDDKRLRVLNCLFETGGLEPNLSKVSKDSGLSVKTVRKSLVFLKKNVISGFIPVLRLFKLGFEVEVFVLLRVDERSCDLSAFLSALDSDDHVLFVSKTTGDSKYNYLFRSIYHDFDDAMSGLGKLLSPYKSSCIMDLETLFLQHPYLKHKTMSATGLGVLNKENSK